MRAIIYCRVSSDPRGRGKSVAEQENDCRAVCVKNGWDVAEVLVDNDRGASRYSRKDRPAYRQLTETLLAGDVLVTWEASRVQRDLAAYVQLRELCAERGVSWSYSGRLYDLSRGDDRFVTGLDALLSEKEVDQSRERVLRAVQANASAGRPHGKVPYGYRIVRDPDSGESIDRVPDEATAPIVREIARRLLAGESAYSIAKDLNARGVATPRRARDGGPGKWAPVSMTRLAANPTYAGLRTHRGEVIGSATWEPLIDVEDHRRLVALRSDPTRLTHRGCEPKWLLSGLARCGVCGAMMRRGKNRGSLNYVCRAKFCTARSLTGTDQHVEEQVIRRLESKDILENLAEKDVGAQEAVDEVQALRDRLEGFTQAAVDGDLSPSMLAKIEQQLRPKIDAAERRVRSYFTSPIVAELAGPDARQKWVDLSFEDRRAVIAAVATIRIAKTRKTRIFNPDSIEIEWN
ncbi:recombinase family protein [Prescottella equi]|uniref:recombinase family protein n=1 Tax=Rhodococcus hoagii TaxID=43767 RepID=UPI000A11C1EC|nr:recombinase family protein [Prescottella equi]